MISNYFLSIVIPVYNASKVIMRCLESIWSQGLLDDEYEVICVDDCSTDQSVDVIKSEMVKHPNLKYIRNKRNLRAGGARNQGVKEASGKYIVFIDSDDYFHTEGLLQAVNHLKCNQSLDILVCNFSRELFNHPNNDFVQSYGSEEILPVNGFIDRGHIPCGPCQWLFKRQIMTDNMIWFRENCICEDVDWTHRLVPYARTIQYQPILLTHYVIGDNTQTANSYATPNNVYAYMDAGKALFKLQESYDRIGCGKYLHSMAKGYFQQGLKYYLAMKDNYKEKYQRIGNAIPKGFKLSGIWRCVQLFPKSYSVISNFLSPFVRFYIIFKSRKRFRGINR